MPIQLTHKGKWTEREWLGLVLPLMAVEWIVFKFFYPYADYFIDSYGYLQAAVQQDAISFRPIGYSLFLRFMHTIHSSDTLVVTVQYVTVQGASLSLVLWLRRWCGLREWPVAVLMAFLLLNPLVPYVCNYISSDAMFIGLSLLWLMVLMQLLRDPGWGRLGLQLILLFAIFHLRYVALFYPAVAALTVLLAKRGWVYSLVGVGTSIGVIVAATLWIKSITKRETGADLFSAFSGWQMANNALNLYTHIPVDTVGMPSPECRELAGYVRDYFVAAVDTGKRDAGVAEIGEPDVGAAEMRKAATVTTAYMWSPTSPLHRYLRVYKQRWRLNYFDAWNRVGVIFTQYGTFVARKHPCAWLQYYSWPSAKTFFWSNLDNFTMYNEGKPEVDKLAKNWFQYPGTKLRVYSATIQARLLAPMTGLYLFLNIAFVGAALWFLPFASLRGREPVFTGSFRLASAFLLANAFFSIFAAPSVLRYQVLPMIVLFIFMVCAISKSREKFVN